MLQVILSKTIAWKLLVCKELSSFNHALIHTTWIAEMVQTCSLDRTQHGVATSLGSESFFSRSTTICPVPAEVASSEQKLPPGVSPSTSTTLGHGFSLVLG